MIAQKINRITLRGIAKAVKNDLKKVARKNGRSLNNECLIGLGQYAESWRKSDPELFGESKK